MLGQVCLWTQLDAIKKEKENEKKKRKMHACLVNAEMISDPKY